MFTAFKIFWRGLSCTACGILVPETRDQTLAPCSLNHWTTREVSLFIAFSFNGPLPLGKSGPLPLGKSSSVTGRAKVEVLKSS